MKRKILFMAIILFSITGIASAQAGSFDLYEEDNDLNEYSNERSGSLSNSFISTAFVQNGDNTIEMESPDANAYSIRAPVSYSDKSTEWYAYWAYQDSGGGNTRFGLKNGGTLVFVDQINAGDYGFTDNTPHLIEYNVDYSTDSYTSYVDGSQAKTGSFSNSASQADEFIIGVNTGSAFAPASVWYDRYFDGGSANQVGTYPEPNSAPVFNSFSTTPSNWTVGDNIDFGYNVSDSDGNITTVRLEVFNSTGDLQKGENFTYSSSNVVDTQTDWYSPQVADDYTVYFTAWDNQGSETVETLSKTAQEPPNQPPVFNETTLNQGAFIGGTPEYQAEAYDPENMLGFISIEITYGSQVRHTDSVNVSNGVLALFTNTFEIQTANKWLNATFTVNDSEGAEATQEVNTFISDTRPSFQINDPENITYQGKDIPYSVDFNDDGDDNPNEQAYCEAYNDGNLVRNATVNESNAGSFSGTITDVPYGFHEFFVSCVEFDQLGNFTTNKSVFYSNEEKPPTVTIDNPSEDEVFTYLEGSGGVDVEVSGSVESDFSGTFEIRDLKNDIDVLQISISPGVNQFNVTQNWVNDDTDSDPTQEEIPLYTSVTSDDTGTVYDNFNARNFIVVNETNPSPVIENVSYDSTVTENNPIDFKVRSSDSTDNLKRVEIAVFNPDGEKQNTFARSQSQQIQWANFSNFYTPREPGNFSLEVSVFDNYNFKTSQNYTLTVSEEPPVLNLTFPTRDSLVATGGVSKYNLTFESSVDVPAPGNFTFYYSTPENNSFVKNGGDKFRLGGRRTVRATEFFNNITYTEIAGEDYSLSDEYSWKIRYVSNATGTVYESGIANFRFSSQEEIEEPEEQLGILNRVFNFLVILFWTLVILLLAFIPIYLKYWYGGDDLF